VHASVGLIIDAGFGWAVIGQGDVFREFFWVLFLGNFLNPYLPPLGGYQPDTPPPGSQKEA